MNDCFKTILYGNYLLTIVTMAGMIRDSSERCASRTLRLAVQHTPDGLTPRSFGVPWFQVLSSQFPVSGVSVV